MMIDKSIYTHSRWRTARQLFLLQNPICVKHLERGLVVEATIVDHKIPHKNNEKLFWDRNNWQALCKQCHDSYKQRLERSGREIGCDLEGIPVDPHHHWAGR